MKKILSIFMSIVMLLSITAGLDMSANAEVLTGNCGANGSNVTYSLNTSTGVLTISGAGKMYDYSSSSYAPWYSNRSSVKTVTISSGVTSIGNDAFCGCSSLTSITIPNGITSIGASAFDNCNSLTSITIPNSVTSIGSAAFFYCSSLTSVTIPDSVTSIGSSAFECCSSLTSITIPNSVTSIGDWAFYACSSLTSITIPDSVTSIGDWTFEYCSRLTSITIPDSVTSIGKYAFDGCSSLKNVYYAGTSSQWKNISIGSYNDKLKNANINYSTVKSPISESLEFLLKTVSGVMTISGNGAIPSRTSSDTSLFGGYDSYIRSVEIESGVTGIGDYAFSGLSSLVSVAIPETVSNISSFAFDNCQNLSEIKIDSNNQYYSSIGIDLFNNDKTALIRYSTNHSDIAYSISNTVTNVKSNAFSGCKNLKSVSVENPNCVLESNSIPSSITIYAHSDSKAQKYASENGNNFISTHIWNDGVETSNGCTVSGVKTYTCKVCGITKQEAVPASGHKVVIDSAVPATCTSSGVSEGSHCSVCSTVLSKQEYIPAYGHSFTNYVSNNDATCTKEGTKTAKCDRCSATNTVTDTGSMVAHNLTKAVVAPNCTDNGYTLYTCTVCGGSYKDNIVNATGHTFSEVVREPATCNREGTMDHVCEICQYAYSTVIPATGQHKYGADGKCIYCNAYNTAAVVSVDGVSYTLNSDKEYVSSKAKKASLSKATGGKKQFKVTWKKVSGISGYQIQYSTDKKFKKNVKNVNAKNSSTSATIKKLKSKKTYYVRIKTYKTVKINGKSTKVYSSWSKVKTVKTK